MPDPARRPVIGHGRRQPRTEHQIWPTSVLITTEATPAPNEDLFVSSLKGRGRVKGGFAGGLGL
jgi:hypothetical protein